MCKVVTRNIQIAYDLIWYISIEYIQPSVCGHLLTGKLILNVSRNNKLAQVQHVIAAMDPSDYIFSLYSSRLMWTIYSI